MSDENSNLLVLKRLQDSLIQATAPQRNSAFVGTFVAMINPNESLIYYNYAVPAVTPNASSLESLIVHFRDNDRVPRFEFFPELWPNLEAMLIEAGFECEMKIPVMLMSPLELQQKDESQVNKITSRFALQQSSCCSALAFGNEVDVSEAQIQSNLEAIQTGQSSCAGIWKDGELVSNGWMIGGGPVCELAGVGTHPEYRTQGLASKVSSFLCRNHFDNGGEHVWLSAGSPESEAVYSKLGFRKIGVQANYCLVDGR